MYSSGLDVDFSSKSLVLEKLFLMLKACLSQSPACLLPAPPPDICTGTQQTSFCSQPQLPLEEASHATKIFISTRIYRSRKGIRVGWRRMKVNRIIFLVESLCFTELGKSAVLLLSDLVIRTEFIDHVLNIMTEFADNTFISTFSILWNFTMRKCHRNKTFPSSYQKVPGTDDSDTLTVPLHTRTPKSTAFKIPLQVQIFFFKYILGGVFCILN